MKAAAAVLVSLAIFAFVWCLVALLIAGVSWAATDAGARAGLFLWINVLLMWVLSPAVGAGVAIYATTTRFRSVDSKTIYVGFVAVCSSFIALGFAIELVMLLTKSAGGWRLALFTAQVLAILGGARLGTLVGVAAREQLVRE